MLAGGGVRGGTVFGASDKLGAYPDRDAVTPGDLAATLFWRFGLDPEAEIRDLTGRPSTPRRWPADPGPLRGLIAVRVPISLMRSLNAEADSRSAWTPILARSER